MAGPPRRGQWVWFGAAALAAACLLAACSREDCAVNADCGTGRICRLGLCVTDPAYKADATSLDVDLACEPATKGDRLVITEILADPGGQDPNGDGNPDASGDEFIEVVNFSDHAVGLANVQVKTGDAGIPLGATCLAPLGARVVWGTEAALKLTNSGKTVSLLVDNLIVQSHTYGSEADKDQSITLAVQDDAESGWVSHQDLAAAPWSPGTCPGGQPFGSCGELLQNHDADATLGDGASGCPPAQQGELWVTEILADPAGQDVDGDGSYSSGGDEFVEVVNFSAGAVSLANVTLLAGDKPIPLGQGCLDPAAARVVFGSESALGLANGGDSVALAIDGATVQVHSYGSEGGKGQSLTLADQLDPGSAWVLHGEVGPGPWSPGTCPNGLPFPDCHAAPPEPDTAEVAPDAELSPDLPGSCGAKPQAGDLLINEINADPAKDVNGDGAATNDDEFVEIVNRGGGLLDLSGVVIREAGGNQVQVPAGTCLEADRALIVIGKAGPGGDLGGALVVAYGGWFKLNNTDDTVTVEAPGGAVLDTVTYGSNAGKDQSITRTIDLDPASPFVEHGKAPTSGGATMSPGRCQSLAAFPACGAPAAEPVPDAATDGGQAEIGPDPGPEPDLPPACGPAFTAGEVVLNEILADPAGADTNGDGVPSPVQDELVEVLSRAAGPRDLGSLVLMAGTTPYGFAPGACLGAGQAVVVFGGGAPVAAPSGATFLAAGAGLGLANGGGTVSLLVGGVMLDSYPYPSSPGVSWTRSPDGTGAFVLHTTAAAASFSPGTCASGEAFPGCAP
jgi:hypothetical protein